MPKICYVLKRFRGDTLDRIRQANGIITEYQAQGFVLTLRQLYYKFIARDLLPDSWIDSVYNVKHGLPPDAKNTEKNYKRLGDIVSDGRLAGMIDWNAIEDRTRNLQSNSHWETPGEIVEACAQQFRLDLWGPQPNYCEVWVEKEALLGIIRGICTKLDVPYFACKGYTSQSEMWGAAQRLIQQEEAGKATFIIHLGDHDPSGIDMTRDIRDRLHLFESNVVVHRVALNMNQIEEYNPPPNPARTTDARFELYREVYGDESWELDALEPKVMVSLIEDTVTDLIDEDRWTKTVEQQRLAQEQLTGVSERWDEIVENL